MRRRLLLVLSLVLGLGLVAAACGGGEEGDEAAGGEATIELDGQAANDHGSEDVAGRAEVELTADDFYFEPTVLEGEAGQEVTLHVTNEGDALHNVSIEDQGIDEDVQADQSIDVTVTFPNSGLLVFVCKYHVAEGMLGGLKVS